MQSIDTRLCSYTCTSRIHILTLPLMASLQAFLLFKSYLHFILLCWGKLCCNFKIFNCLCWTDKHNVVMIGIMLAKVWSRIPWSSSDSNTAFISNKYSLIVSYFAFIPACICMSYKQMHFYYIYIYTCYIQRYVCTMHVYTYMAYMHVLHNYS